MPQLFKTETRDADSPGLSTADLAHANDRTSSSGYDEPIDNSTTTGSLNNPTALRSGRDPASVSQRDASLDDTPFFDHTEEPSNVLDRSEGDPIAPGNGRAGARTASMSTGSMSRTPTASQNTDSSEDGASPTPLFTPEESKDFHSRWDSVQVGFVDEPRRAVQQADSLVASAMQRLAEIFAEERANLDQQWDRGDSVSTEDLRLALRRYRSFFGRLLSV